LSVAEFSRTADEDRRVHWIAAVDFMRAVAVLSPTTVVVLERIARWPRTIKPEMHGRIAVRKIAVRMLVQLIVCLP
jgi:hypothetical protein